MPRRRIAYFANSDWYLYNFRAPLAQAAREAFDAEIHALCPDGPHRPKLEAMGFRWSETPLERQGANPFRELELQRRVEGILSRVNPDLLHNFTLKPVIWGTLAARKNGQGIRIVNALTGMGSVFRGNSLKAKMLRLIVMRLLKRALAGKDQRTIFQNPDDLRMAVEHLSLCPDASALIRGSGVDLSRFAPSPAPPSAPIVLFIGRLLKDKGIHDFCAAAAEVHKTHPQVRFRLAGAPDPGNPSSLSAAELAEIKKRQPYLEFLGHVEDPARCYRESSMAVLPSYGEGVPRSLIEAAACGLPLIATNVPGCREIVKDNDNGILVPPKDPPSLAQAIRRLADDPDLCMMWGRYGRLLVEAEFSERSVLAATLEIYRALLGSDQPR